MLNAKQFICPRFAQAASPPQPSSRFGGWHRRLGLYRHGSTRKTTGSHASVDRSGMSRSCRRLGDAPLLVPARDQTCQLWAMLEEPFQTCLELRQGIQEVWLNRLHSEERDKPDQ